MTALTILFKNSQILIAQSYAGDDTPFADNVGLHVGDNSKAVLGRRADLLTSLTPYGVQTMSWLNQIHGDGIFDNQFLPISPPSADAQITDKPHHALAIMTADCVPVAVFDEQGEQVACIHAGWQGLVAGIIQKTLDKFRSNSPKFAYIGACIGGASYELPMAMASEILQKCLDEKWVTLAYADLFQAVIAKVDNDKAYLDVGALARCQLVACGVQVINEQTQCTYTGNYHSHRRATHQGVQTGRMAMVIAKL